ncbi:electron transfer flavoprotein subunit alpha/FixB family protein [Paraburkholderia sp. EG287A]|uniref:electron transfer flavoprotein subunit alpha/FixB family protein n=1 Tax=unclassified Paraburkholderia TaxID=2615204 RepID=UPI0034D2FFCA
MRTLVLAEGDFGAISDGTLRVVGAARQFGQPVDLLVFDATTAGAAAHVSGIERVLLASAGPIDVLSPETVALQLQQLAGDYTAIVAAHRSLGRAALPRAAALTQSAFVADVIAWREGQQFVRGLYAGSVVATVVSDTPCTFVTVRPSSFAAAAADGGSATVTELRPIAPFAATRLVERHRDVHGGQDLGNARVVMSGGRGLASKANMARLGRLADTLGAALGASRAAVDAGYAANAAQVGQTGRSVAPDVYVAFGISGAIQHLAGMKDSKVIVAVNKDSDAPIFSVADVGLVGDLFDVIGAIEARVQQAGPDA